MILREVLRHLVHGWQGFVGILSRATAGGERMADDDLSRLERMQGELAGIIERQKRLTSKTGES